MFSNFSLPELLIVAALALIVIGPKDLPRMLRSVGKFVGQARGLARQFQDSMNDAAREVDLAEFREARKLMDKKTGLKSLTDDLEKSFDEVEAPARSNTSSKSATQTVAEQYGLGKPGNGTDKPVPSEADAGADAYPNPEPVVDNTPEPNPAERGRA